MNNMAKHLDTGKRGEEIAAEHLAQSGFVILEKNWRHRRSEVDLIAKDGKVLVFVEVKTRSYDYFGKPEEFVSPKKVKKLTAAATAYMELSGHDWEIRFDVVSILKNKAGEWTVEHLRDAFFSGME